MSLSSFASSLPGAGAISAGLSAVNAALNGVPAKINAPAVIVGSIVSLGDPSSQDPFFFSEFELPSHLTFGSYQMSATHNFIGGGRAVDLYGAQPHPIELTGELFDLGPNPPLLSTHSQSAGPTPRWNPSLNTAMQRLQFLHSICVAGKKVLFQFHQFKFWCVVVDATFDALHWHDARYTVKLEVLYHNLDKGVTVDPAKAAKLNPPAQEGLLHKFTSFMSTMNGYIAQGTHVATAANAIVSGLKTHPESVLLAGVAFIPGSAQVNDFITRGQAAATAATQLNNTLFPQYVLDMTNAQPYNSLDNSAYQKYLMPSTKVIHTALRTTTHWQLNDYPLIAAPKLKIAADPGQVVNAAVQGRRSLMALSDMHQTMARIIQPARSYYLQVSNPNLAKIALQVYGDASKWQVLAQANNLTHMVNTGFYTLVIPYADQFTGNTPTLAASTSAGI